MEWLRQLSAELIVEVDDPAAFADGARGWLSDLTSDAFGDSFEELRSRPVMRRGKGASGPLGEPGRVLGVLRINQKHPVFKGKELLYSEESWSRFLAGLEDYPFAADVSVMPLDERGYGSFNIDGIHVRVARDFFAPAWVSYTFMASAATGWAGSPQIQGHWAELLKTQAGRIGACAGGVTDDIAPGGPSALQRWIVNPSAQINDSRKVLRGYTWITIVAPELAYRLDGLTALSASGAFHEVEELPNGAIWLRATPTINEFTGYKIRQVFEALAPVLVTGRTQRRGHEVFRLAEDVDAADYQD